MKNAPLWIAAIGLSFVICYTYFLNGHGFCYDEPIYLENLGLLNKYGFSKEFIIRLIGPAGPLYATIHWMAEPFTQLQVAPTRTINIVFVIFILAIIFKTIDLLNPGNGKIAFLLFAVPMTYPTTGMALTEIPAMLFFVFSLYFLIRYFKDENGSYDFLLAIIGGLFMSIAILGRQPYLLVLGALCLMFFFPFTRRKKIGVILFFVCSLAFPIFIFSIWKNIVPQYGGDIATEKGLAPTHFLLALGYTFLTFLFLCPTFLMKINKKLVLIYSVVFFLLILLSYLFGFSFTPLMTLMKRALPTLIWKWYGHILFSLLVIIGIYFLHSCVIRIIERLNNFYYVTLMIMLLAILFSCITITHQFSSRYVFQAAPLCLLIVSFHTKEIKLSNVLLFSAGLTIGVLSLVNYC